MADIKDQLIKDSYNYVLQSDLSTGVVYRIGGSIPVNPIFSSGLTINDSFVYSGAGEQNGYALLTDGTGYAYWGPVSGASPSSGVTSISVGNGLSASSSTGAVTIVFTGSTSVSGDYLPLSGGTVTGNTIFQSGLTATTISATTYYNLPVTADTFVTGFTLSSNTITLSQNRNDAYSSFTISLSAYTGSSLSIGGGGGQLFYLNLSQSQGSNRLLSTTGSTASEQTTGVTINNGVTGSIASFQSQPLNITLLPGGIWSFYLHSYKQNNNASFNIFVEVYKRTSGGTQTLLFSTDPTPVTTNSPNPSMQLSDSYFSGTTLLVSDSIVATVRATNTGNQSHTITLVTEGSTHYSYVVSTIPTQQGLTCDTLSGCTIIQTIQTDLTNKLDKSGGTISGGLVVNSGLTANTISATTYQNLPVSGVTGGTGISASTSNGNVTIINTSPDQTVTITGGTNIQINGSYPNFGIDFTGGTILKYYISATTPTGIINNGDRWFNTTDGVELVYVTDGDGPQWVQPNNGGSNTGTTSGGDYLPISGGTVTGNTTFSSGVALNALTSSEEINNIVADSAGNLYTYTDGVTISAGSDPAVNSGMFKTNRTVDIGGTLYRVYNIKAEVVISGSNNTFVNYIGVVSGSTNYAPSLTKSLVIAQDPTFNRVQTPLTTYALVYDETLLFAAPVDLMTVNYDNTLGNPDEYYIFSIAANTNNFSCDLQVDYEFLVLETDVITFTN